MLSLFILAPLLLILLLNLPFWRLGKLAFWPAAALFAAQVFFVVFPSAAPHINLHLPFLLGFKIDALSVVMLLSIGIVAMTSLIIGQSTIEENDKKFLFTNLVILAAAGMNGIVLVSDLFSLYVFLEIAAVSSFVLIASHKEKLALEGALKYLILSSLATVLMLFAIALLMFTSGSTSFVDIYAALHANQHGIFTILAVALFTCGLFIKGGIVPFHGWLPDAYSSAPSEVSVLLAGIVTKTSGIYTLARLLISVFGTSPQIEHILLLAGIVSVFYGAFAALKQNDLKRMLAYSSISQVGYIVLGLGTGTGLGIAGAVFHIFNHSIFKTQLFANAAAIEKQTGTRDMEKLGGLAEKMPVTSATSMLAFLSTAGIPPLSGFWSKLIIIIALWQSGNQVYAFMAVIASLITLAYFLSMNRRIFFGTLKIEFANIKEAGAGMLIPVIALSAITIAAGVLIPFVLARLILPLINL